MGDQLVHGHSALFRETLQVRRHSDVETGGDDDGVIRADELTDLRHGSLYTEVGDPPRNDCAGMRR